MAEWLKRQTRNLFRSPGVGSNPTGVVFFLLLPTPFRRLPRVFPGRRNNRN